MNKGNRPRYPGSPPFADSDLDRKLFWGRPRESEIVLHSILTNDLLVFFGISGSGKTSLLRAGVVHKLRDRDLWPVLIRLNDPNSRPVDLIHATLRQQQIDPNADIEILGVEEKPRDLWDLLSGLEIWRGDVLQLPVLIFDQFEEIFTLWNSEARDTFITEFGHVVRGTRPSHPDEQRGPDRRVAPDMRIVLSLREDFLGGLESFSIDVPQILSQRYRLRPLTRHQAEEAIRVPANVVDDRLKSPSFAYHDETVKEILDFLSKEEQRGETVTADAVEAFQLQIVCQHIEDVIVPLKLDELNHVDRHDSGQEDTYVPAQIEVTPSDVGGVEGLSGILGDFYRRQLDEFSGDRRKRIRDLCETGLISSRQRRLSLEKDEIKDEYAITQDELEQLVQQRLLRAEPRVGSVYYELAHDSLVKPILAHREQKIRANKRSMAVIISTAAVLVSVLALSGLTARLLNGGDDPAFSAPQDLKLVPAVESLLMPDVSGSSDPVARLEALGFLVIESQEPSAVVPAGRAILQSPPPGIIVDEGSQVLLVTSLGPDIEVARVVVADVVGLSHSEAVAVLNEAGLLAIVIESFSRIVSAGIVMDQDPTGGTAVPPGTEVTVVVSLGPESECVSEGVECPRLVAPTEGEVFDHFPRTTPLRWLPVEGASEYDLEIEYGQPPASAPCCWSDRYISERTISTEYTFDFVGAQPGRWRVRTVYPDGTMSVWSDYRLFFYTR